MRKIAFDSGVNLAAKRRILKFGFRRRQVARIIL